MIMVLLCILLIISIIRRPFDSLNNPCKFKILEPKFYLTDGKKIARFTIIVKKHRYFINFPLLFKFYSDSNFKSHIRVLYHVPQEEPQELIDDHVEFTTKVKEHVVYITDVILGRITIEINLEVEYGNPIVGFEIMQNNTCQLTKEHKLEIKFPY